MRLSKIKLAGFKSFVDPTVINLRSNLTSIVGPNGCGKSNIIDAVRWVMGESSAKHLRGASMDDVIFKGSSTRKPVGQAHVELVFDNSDASLGGEYAQFSEISIKRLVTREGQSKYFLNGTRCRRRDITDIFLGTGLGPRSYAIIEQGMISRLIEAKPEELRVYIEEAAGISKYKERRRETENRMRHTRDNLERLDDLREEIEKQLSRLKRQANAAKRYKDFKSTQRRLEAELLVLNLRDLQHEIDQREVIINEHGLSHQAVLSTQRRLEREIEQDRLEHHNANKGFNQIQAHFYQLGAKISRLEQTLQHQQTLKQKQQQQAQQLKQEQLTSQTQYDEDCSFIEEAQAQRDELLPQQESITEEYLINQATLDDAEHTLLDWQQQWNTLQETMAEPIRQVQVEKARREQIEHQLQDIKQRLERLQSEQSLFDTDHDELELATLEQRVENNEVASEQLQAQFDVTQTDQHQQQQKNKVLTTRLNEQRLELQSLNGRLASLEALQQAGLGKGKQNKQLQHWLTQQGLDNKPRLAENIRVKTGWETAVETVLGQQLEAIQCEDFNTLHTAFKQQPKASFSLYTDQKHGALMPLDGDYLARKIEHPKSLQARLGYIYCADDLDQALKQQPTLQLGESIITPDGTWMGENWLQFKGENHLHDGVLARQKEIKALLVQIEQLVDAIAYLEAQFETNHVQQGVLEAQKTEQQKQLNEQHRQQSELISSITTLENRIQQTQLNQTRVINEIDGLTKQKDSEHQRYIQATERGNAALKQTEILSNKRDQLQAYQEDLQAAVDQHREASQHLQEQTHHLQLQVENLNTNIEVGSQQLHRLRERLEQLKQRERDLEKEQQHDFSEENLEEQLHKNLQVHHHTEIELTDSHQILDTLDHQIREKETQRIQAEQKVEQFRSLLETLKMEWQERTVQAQTLKQSLSETAFSTEVLLEALEGTEIIETHQEQLKILAIKITRLGAINLAAIDEYQSQHERKVYFDEQNQDLQQALDMLESAMRKIDKDTRTRFKSTFDEVNRRVSEMFPRLFGGGEAKLEMTGDDLLTTGVTIMARPPGKRISSIQLMSGGEKALTAVTMVFAIFELNPAPFCMLDEVDAPLDEANVRRFSALVKHMSERVQFIFITHNKTTMERAENLIGVTMREPGVSRTVAVAVDEATRMAQA